MARNKTESKKVTQHQDFTLFAAIPSVGKTHTKHLPKVEAAMRKSLEGYDYEFYIAPPGDGGLPEMVESFNKAADKALEKSYDYIWFVEADVLVPPNAFKQLLLDDADVAAGVVPYHKVAPVYENLMVAGRFLSEGSLRTVNLHKVDVVDKVLKGDVFAGVNCLLIKKKVFEDGLRFVHNLATAGFDMLFWKAVRLRGFKLVVDGRVICEDLD